MKVYDMKDYSKEAVKLFKMFDCDTDHGMALNLPNNRESRLLIALLRKGINKRFTITVRGSQSDRLSYRNGGVNISEQSVPLKYSDRLRVYINGVKNLTDVEREQLESIASLEKQRVEDLREQLAGMHTKYAALNDFYNARGNKIQDLINELSDVKEQARKFKYFGASQEEIDLCERYVDTVAVRMCKSLYTGQNKLQVVKLFKDGTGQGLRDCKTVCDYLVFK